MKCATDLLRFVAAAALVSLPACGSTSEPAAAPYELPPAGEDDDGKADAVTEGKKSDFFAADTFWYVRIKSWDPQRMGPSSLAEATQVDGAELEVFRARPDVAGHCPDAEVGEGDRVHATADFSLRTSGNFTNGTPKSSYKVKFTAKAARLFGMRALNLKAMWNDVSQMRESIAWDQFRKARVAAPRHTYARFCIDGRYYGLYSVIEQVDESFLGTHFGDNDEGNLYKAYWEDIGPATLEHRKGADGDDSGRQYFTASDIEERTYQLQTNEKPDDDPKLQTYDDLAAFIRTINGVGLPGDGMAKFDTPQYREAVEAIFDVRGFLRWAGVNTLLGAWDNYYRTPSNYYLYNSGPRSEPKGFMSRPYFHWIPWDYDNSLGIDPMGIDWQYGDIVDWRKTSGGPAIPLVENLLANSELRAYYLDHLDHVLDAAFREDLLSEALGAEGSGGTIDRVRLSAFLEADGPQSPPHTGRQFTNDQIYWNGFEHQELWWAGSMHAWGIKHFVIMRQDSARKQLAEWRKLHPKGSSGASFPDPPTAIPE